MLRFLESFDVYGDSPTGDDLCGYLGRKWNGICLGLYGEVSIVQGYGNGKAICFGPSASASRGALGKYIGDQAEIYLGFHIQPKGIYSYYSGSPPLVYFMDHEDEQAYLLLNQDSTVSIYTGGTGSSYLRATTTATLPTDSWTHVEFYVKFLNSSSGEYELRFNGTTVAQGNADTSMGNPYASGILFTWYYNEYYLDDVFILDGQAGLSGFLGPRKVSAHFPAADSSTAWTCSSGTDHYALVNSSAPDTDTYLFTDISGNTDLLTINAPSTSDIDGIQLCVEGAATGSAPEGIKAVIQKGINTLTTTKHLIDPVYSSILVQAESPPGESGAWTPSDFSSTYFGIEKVS